MLAVTAAGDITDSGVLTIGGTTYSFSLVLAVYLLGLGVGALLIGAWWRRRRGRSAGG